MSPHHLIRVCALLFALVSLGEAPSTLVAVTTAPTIRAVTTNLNAYPGGQVPRYARFELTFQVDTVASNPQFPYDQAPPPGVTPALGITVNALFSPDNWQTTYTQPAFLYQDFLHEMRSGRDWLYPTDHFAWKVRFSPPRAGVWQVRLSAQDAGGTTLTPPQSFTVVPSSRPGFIRVSDRDARYFEFENGGYFPALGYNLVYNQLDWTNPTLTNAPRLDALAAHGVQLARIWLSQWAIYGSWWNPWQAQDPALHAEYLPYSGITFEEAYPGSEVSMKLDWAASPCQFLGFAQAPPAVKRNATYRFRVRYKTSGITGPRVAGRPYGLAVKTGGWLWGEGAYCYDAGVGTLLAGHITSSPGWTTLEGTLNVGERDFLPNFYLVLENVTGGKAFIDYVWLEEALGGGGYGPNIVSKPWMAHHLYFEQRNSFAFDLALELAEQYGVYLRPVLLEKNEYIFNRIDFNGAVIPDDPRCADNNPANDPPRCPGNRWFYGNDRQVTKTRWLLQAYWRYVQARWGYSTHIHSWELLNEGDPWNTYHYALADELGRFMRQFRPNHHLVSTSMWHSFPRDGFWANSHYPNIDFADVHEYIWDDDPVYYDTALATESISRRYGALQPGGAGKPIIRGETGLARYPQSPTRALDQDTDGIWLHNFIWGGLNSGGLIESYWWVEQHIARQDRDGVTLFDHRRHYRSYLNFVEDLPLTNGYYQDAGATTSQPNLRAWGQQDLLNGRAHLWIANTRHTWQNVVEGAAIPALTGSIDLSGFQPGRPYTVEWWDPYQPDKTRQLIRTETLTAQPDGRLRLSIVGLRSDIAVKVSPRCTDSLMGDVNCDCRVNTNDLRLIADAWGTQVGEARYEARLDLDGDGRINVLDVMLAAARWGNECGGSN